MNTANDKSPLPFSPVKKDQIQISNDTNYKDFLDYLKVNFLKLFQEYFSKDEELSLPALELVYTNFHYLWADEYCDEFYRTLIKADKKMQAQLCKALIYQPNTLMYFLSALTYVFNNLWNVQNAFELVKIFQEYSVKLAPMLPLFVRKCLSLFEKPQYVFWEMMKPVIENFELFDLAHKDLYLFDHDIIVDMIFEFEDFFHTQGALYFIHQIIDNNEICSSIPQESKISKILNEYQPLTLIPVFVFNMKYHNFTIDNISPVPVFVAPNIELERGSTEKFEEDVFFETVSRFLLRAELTRVRSVTENDPRKYFTVLAELSSIYGDPDLEDDLDQVVELLHKSKIQSIDELLQQLENYLISKSQHPQNLPLNKIATYSLQQNYIMKMTEFVGKFETRKNEIVEFDNTISKLNKTTNLPTINYEGDVSQEFLNVYDQITNSIEARTLSELRACIDHIGLTNSLFTHLTQSVIERDTNLRYRVAHFGYEIFNSVSASWLDPFIQDKSKFEFFNTEILAAVNTKCPLDSCYFINNAMQTLVNMLDMTGMKDIGADQLTPIFIVAICHLNPGGLIILSNILNHIVLPLFNLKSPVDRQIEYACVQFVSAVKTIEDFKLCA